MRKNAALFQEKYLNGGTALVLMGAQWLYLWAVPWYQVYRAYPHWGHNYAEALAFLSIGLAYYNRRLVSYILAFVTTTLVIPASLELVSHSVTAIIGVVLLALIIADIAIERKREHDWGQPANQRLTFWLKRHLPRFSFIMLAHMALLYFFVRLPVGTYETDLVTKVFDGMVITFVFMLLFEDMAGIASGSVAKRLGFFWGMSAMIVSLGLLSDQPETWPHLIFTGLVTAFGIASLAVKRKSAV